MSGFVGDLSAEQEAALEQVKKCVTLLVCLSFCSFLWLGPFIRIYNI